MPEVYLKLSEVVEALNGHGFQYHGNGDYGLGYIDGVKAAIDFIARSGLGVEGIKGYAAPKRGDRGYEFFTEFAPRADERPAILLLPASEDEAG